MTRVVTALLLILSAIPALALAATVTCTPDYATCTVVLDATEARIAKRHDATWPNPSAGSMSEMLGNWLASRGAQFSADDAKNASVTFATCAAQGKATVATVGPDGWPRVVCQ